MEKIPITILYLIFLSIMSIMYTHSTLQIFASDSNEMKNLEENESPILVVTKTIRAMEGENVVLDGGKSYDIEGDSLSFFWKQLTPANLKVVLSKSTSAISSFTAPNVERDTRLLFQLVLNDGHGNTQNQNVAVIITNNDDKNKSPRHTAENTKNHIGINNGNVNLVHNKDAVITDGFTKHNEHSLKVQAGEDLKVVSGKKVSLKVKAISQNSDDIKIIWSQIGGPKIQLSSKYVLDPFFIAPDVVKSQIVRLKIEVTNDFGNSASDTTNIKINPKQEPDIVGDSSTKLIDNTDKDNDKTQQSDFKNQTETALPLSNKFNSMAGVPEATTSAISSDKTSPTVVSTSPANAARGVSLGTLVKATFSEAIQSPSVTSSTFTVRDSTTSTYIAGSRSVSGSVITFTPSSNLRPSTMYMVTITTGVKDLAGNPMTSTKKWYFVTTSVTSSNNLYDDFQGGTYSLPEGGISPNGKWVDKWNGYGQAGVKTINGNNVFYEIPKTAIQPSTTHSSLVQTSQKFSDFTLELDMNTYKQLRQNSPPNTWETAWVFWRAVDLYHSYYFVLKTNGIEFGKKDTNCNCEEQVFLKTASTPKVQLGIWSHIKISSIGKHATVWVDGSKVVDMDDPSYNSAKMSNGYIGLYNEDASVGFDNVRIGPP
jgi:hypothetical protein